MTYSIDLPLEEGAVTHYTLGEPRWFVPKAPPFTSRVAFAAAHVVATPSPALPLKGEGEREAAGIDWDATLAYRRHLWSYGFAVAEAMDTSQRGMGLDWPMAQELIRRSIAEAKSVGGAVASRARVQIIFHAIARSHR